MSKLPDDGDPWAPNNLLTPEQKKNTSRTPVGQATGKKLRKYTCFNNYTSLQYSVSFRFSSDTDIMDNRLPETYRVWLGMVFSTLASLIVIIVTTPIFTAIIVPVVILCAFLVVSLFCFTDIKSMEFGNTNPENVFSRWDNLSHTCRISYNLYLSNDLLYFIRSMYIGIYNVIRRSVVFIDKIRITLFIHS